MPFPHTAHRSLVLLWHAVAGTRQTHCTLSGGPLLPNSVVSGRGDAAIGHHFRVAGDTLASPLGRKGHAARGPSDCLCCGRSGIPVVEVCDPWPPTGRNPGGVARIKASPARSGELRRASQYRNPDEAAPPVEVREHAFSQSRPLFSRRREGRRQLRVRIGPDIASGRPHDEVIHAKTAACQPRELPTVQVSLTKPIDRPSSSNRLLESIREVAEISLPFQSPARLDIRRRHGPI